VWDSLAPSFRTIRNGNAGLDSETTPESVGSGSRSAPISSEIGPGSRFCASPVALIWSTCNALRISFKLMVVQQFAHTRECTIESGIEPYTTTTSSTSGI
jgi:hypothetical protein